MVHVKVCLIIPHTENLFPCSDQHSSHYKRFEYFIFHSSGLFLFLNSFYGFMKTVRGGGREQEKERDRSFILSFSYSEAHLSVKECFQYVLHM